MKKRLFVPLLLWASTVSGQNLGGMQRDLSEFNSPQVASMLRFDESSVNLNVGRFNLEIPLIDFPDRDFRFPVSLQYNSAGYKPNDPENFVGLNWTLQPICAIYREVKGIPDDLSFHSKGKHTGLNPDYEEFCGFLSIRDRPTTIRKEDIMNNPDEYAPLGKTAFARIKNTTGTGLNIEASSDIYRFNVDSYSGFFMIDYDGMPRAICTSGGVVKIDISQYQMMPKDGSKTNRSKIIIKGDNGYTYIFGGSYSAMEYHAVTWDFPTAGSALSDQLRPSASETEPRLQVPAVSAFFLSEVIAPNGRNMTIEYDTTVDQSYSNYHLRPYEILWNLSYKVSDSQPYYKAPQELRKCYQIKAEYYARSREQASLVYDAPGTGTFGPLFDKDKNISVKKIAIIKRIRTDNKIVDFYYSPRDKGFPVNDYHLELAGLTAPTDKLDKITLRIAGSLEQVTELNYYDNGNLFLTGVNNSKMGKYKFTYIGMGNSPISPLTMNVDHWKFWRGNTSSQGTIPRIRILKNTNGDMNNYIMDQTILSDIRDPASTGFDRNMLSSVEFPTGGKTEYTYELHEYGNYLYRGSDTNYRPVCLGTEEDSRKAGGTRIKNIKYFDKSGLVKQTNYLYSGGILLQVPNYVVPLRYKNDGKEETKKYIFLAVYNSHGYNNMSYDSDHVQYRYVKEINAMPGNSSTADVSDWAKISGYKITIFSDVIDHCDLNWMMNSSYDRVYECEYCKSLHQTGWPDWLLRLGDMEFYSKAFRDYGDRSIERGKIENESYYSAAGDLLKSVDYTYTRYPEGYDFPPGEGIPYMIYSNTPSPLYLTILSRWTQINRKFYYQYNLSKKTVTDYHDSKPAVESVEEYKYDEMGEYLKELKKYNSDGTVSRTEYKYVKDVERWTDKHPKNAHTQYSLPIQTTFYLDSIRLYAAINSYKTISTAPGQSTDNIAFSPATTKILSRSYVLSPDQCQITDYMNYDKYGNPVYIVKDGVSNIVYLWGYKGHHAIAKIENATYDQVTEALDGISPAVVLSYDPELLKKLRNNPVLKNALVTTYQYADLIGVSKVTDPSGRVTTYEYDKAGRLVKVLDEAGNPVSEYQYLYVNQ